MNTLARIIATEFTPKRKSPDKIKQHDTLRVKKSIQVIDQFTDKQFTLSAGGYDISKIYKTNNPFKGNVGNLFVIKGDANDMRSLVYGDMQRILDEGGSFS